MEEESVMTKRMSDKGLGLTIDSEGCRLKAYPDPGTGGDPWTIGYGHTKDVKPGMICTKEQALQWLKEDVVWAEDCVNNLVKVPISQNQFDALVDFVFNVGAGNFGSSTLLKKLNAGKYDEVDAEIEKWTRGGGKVLPGLVARRDKEADLFDDQAPDVA